MSSPHLGSSRRFVTQLFNALDAPTSDERDTTTRYEGSHPLEGAGSNFKNQLLALHVVFPNEMLPALDLLDRGMVTRLCIRRDQEDVKQAVAPEYKRGENCETGTQTKPASTVEDAVKGTLESIAATTLDTVYYIRSTQQRSSRFSTSYDTLTFYECRLNAWHCSCPAFVFSAFPLHHPEAISPPFDTCKEESTIMESGWNFGGLGQDEDIPPACKHLLACVLIEKCAGLFGGCVEERIVDVEEAAGWAAGWGD